MGRLGYASGIMKNTHYIHRQYRLSLAPAVHASLQRHADEAGLTVSQFLDRLLLIHCVEPAERVEELRRRRAIISKRTEAVGVKLKEMRACMNTLVDALVEQDTVSTVEGVIHHE